MVGLSCVYTCVLFVCLLPGGGVVEGVRDLTIVPGQIGCEVADMVITKIEEFGVFTVK